MAFVVRTYRIMPFYSDFDDVQNHLAVNFGLVLFRDVSISESLQPHTCISQAL